ncbi:branched-chain amino acid transport system II carrier protein [Facklamia hominis]|uniref:branched-chain amino acid transport system II carrier protein n=1 Tax=Facklamia hominis TaxID=178214 RepID=UPI0003546D9A|nr:branched-chain amino acid transport system II carrier protein [Facklamia hominis]EPH09436.1 branched-chain amino acid transport system II carrier protein [Facklamia hominis ACS-120-V-Sch10]
MINDSLRFKQRLMIASMLFGLFFGAGNIIFPVFLGQLAGDQVFLASLGFNLTAVGLPMLAIAAMAVTESESVYELSLRVSKPFAVIFTVGLYLMIGPLFAIPRLATVSYEVGVASWVDQMGLSQTWGLAAYSLLFFGGAYLFSRKSSNLIQLIGQWMTPLLILLLALVFAQACLRGNFDFPSGTLDYPLANSFIKGYDTMDGLAGLAFGIVIIRSIRSLGLKNPHRISQEVLLSGGFCVLMMGLVYFGLILLGADSLNYSQLAANGGEALPRIVSHYFGWFGQILLTLIVIVACFKTTIGLVVAFSQAFQQIFPGSKSWLWSVLACLVPGLLANVGLDRMIALTTPFLMLIYPLAMVLILLALLANRWASKRTYQICLWVTAFFAVFDFINHSPAFVKQSVWGGAMIRWAKQHFLFYQLGLAWFLPLILTLGVCFIFRKRLADQ